jgi:hypothetical protein
MHVHRTSRSGWVTLSGVLVLILGVFNVVWGYGALEKKELFDPSRLIYSNLEFWGWFFVIVGALQILTAVLLFVRSSFGWLFAICGASVSAMIAFFALLANTDWALAILALDVVVLWSLLAHTEDFAPGEPRRSV